MHRLNRVHRIETVITRRLETEFRAKLMQKLCAWLFPNSHRAIALDIAVAAHRTQPAAGLADLSAQQHQIHNFLNVRDRIFVLGQAHRPAEDHALRVNEDAPCVFDFDFRDARLFEDVAPVRLAERRREFIKTARMFFYEFMIENLTRAPIFRVENFLHDSLKQRHIAVDAYLQDVQTSWGCLKRVSPVSGSGLMCTTRQPRRFACSSEVSIRG